MITAAALLVAGLLAGEPAAERPLDEALQLDAGASCFELPTLAQHIASWRSQGTSLDARVAIMVSGSESDPHVIRFEIWVGSALWMERSFDAAPDDCAQRYAVVSLAIAIALDDELAQELGLLAPEPEPQPQPPEPVEQVREDELPRNDEPPPPSSGRRTRLGLSAAAGVFAGVHPQLAAGGSLTFDMRPRDHFDVRLGALITHAPAIRFEEGSVASTLTAGRVDLCWGTTPQRVRLRLCGGVAGGAMLAQGRGFAPNYLRAFPWIAALAGIDLVVQLVGPLALELRIDGFLAPRRTIVEIVDEGTRVGELRYPLGGMMVGVGPRIEF